MGALATLASMDCFARLMGNGSQWSQVLLGRSASCVAEMLLLLEGASAGLELGFAVASLLY